MDRYYNTNHSRPSDERQSKSSNRIVLPEYIPFNATDTTEQDKICIPSAPKYSNSVERQRRRSQENGNRVRSRSRSPPHAYHSPIKTPKDRQKSPKYNNHMRNRSRSPDGRSRNEQSYHGRDDRSRERHHRSSSDRNRSVFDRMSSPPKQRRFGEPSGSRRSIESNHNIEQSQFVRTVNHPAHLRNHDEVSSVYRDPELVRRLEVDKYTRRDLSPLSVIERDYRNPSRPDENSAELRLMRERIIAAEKHCRGVQATVRAYEREVLKLQQLVDTLWEDYQTLQSRFR